MPGRKRGRGPVERKRPRRKPARKSGRATGRVLLVGAALAFLGGAAAAIVMVGEAGRVETGALAVFGVFAALAVVLGGVGVGRLRGR